MDPKAIFTYAPLGVFALTMLTFVLPCRFRVRTQAVWAMALLLAASKFVCFAAFGGDAFAPELPEKLIWFWDWAYSGAMILFGFSILLFFVPFRLKRVLLPLVAWSLSAWGLWNGVRVSDVVEREVAVPDLPASLEGYRILQISDLHVSAAARRWRTEAVVARANAANPDLAVVTGDLVDGTPERRRRDVEPIKDLVARDGVWFITGNHEFYCDFPSWRPWYDRWGMRFLRGECVRPHPGLMLAGTDDECVRLRFVGDVIRRRGPTAAAKDLFAGASNGVFKVLLQHRPKFAPLNVSEGVDLQLSGHTHGGIAPILSELVRRHNGGFVRGFYDFVHGGRLFVSPGTGQWAGFPMRFFNDSEITVLRLTRRKGTK